jgi:RNA polymerase sigma-70 factor (ECF subfamily)
MHSAAPMTSAAAPADPIRVALADERILADLACHARAVIGRTLVDRRPTEREELAATAIQETARRALAKYGEYDPNASAAAWLHGILNYVLLESVREVRGRPVQPPELPEEWERLTAVFSPVATLADDRSEVARILTQLSAEQQELLKLRYIEGLEPTEIAARLAISQGNARVRLCRALAAARNVAGVAPGEASP